MVVILDGTVCPGSSDPFDTVTYYINGSLLPGHMVAQNNISYFNLLKAFGYIYRVVISDFLNANT